MADEQIILIDKIEEAEDNKGKAYLKITDKAGVTRNIKEGRNNLLTNKGHLLEEGVAIKLHFQDYKTPEGKVFPFVKDFEVVKDEFVKQATEKVQGQVKVERNESIEAQVSQKGGIEILKALIEMSVLNEAELQECVEYAMASVKWAMERIALPSVIIEKIEEAKGETVKDSKDNQETQTGLTAQQDSGKATDKELPQSVGEFLTWVYSHGKEYNRAWLEAEYGVGTKEQLTIEKCQSLYKQICEKGGW